MNGGLDSWTATSLALQRGQDPVKWMFHYYVRFAEGSHERIHFENLYGFSMYLLEIMLVSTVKTSIAALQLLGESDPNMKPQVMSDKISSSMKWTLEEVNLVSEFVSMFNWFEGI